jgi:hypothetical protein
MKVEQIRAMSAEHVDEAKKDAPNECKGCSNLIVTKNTHGKLLLKCSLAAAPTNAIRGEETPRAKATTGWLNSVVNDQVFYSDDGDSKRNFKSKLDAANDGCPIIPRIAEELAVIVDSKRMIDLQPPQGVLS